VDHEKIRQLRIAKEMTHEQAAKAAGLRSRQQWFLIETGKYPDVRVSTLEKIAKALGCKPAELLK
jgi:DNA-binding Xre family transcriptional regulator